AHNIANLNVVLARSELDNLAHTLVAGHEGRRWLDRPVSLGCMEVGMADSAGVELDQGLVPAGLGQINLPDGQCGAELLDDGGGVLIDCSGHDGSLLGIVIRLRSKTLPGNVFHVTKLVKVEWVGAVAKLDRGRRTQPQDISCLCLGMLKLS